MVCTANDLHGWKDFPKGLRVLLLDGDTSSAAEIKTKLEEMEYVVVSYCNENDALSAISSKPETFHVAIVEVTTSNHEGNFKFLEAAKDLPTIMISNIHCLSTMMKCIALGAMEFLQKPLSDDKLRNIWQHVVHKAFNAGGSAVPNSLKPIKESVVSMLHLELENSENENQVEKKLEILSGDDDNNHELLEGSDKYPAPSTPQQKHGMRLVDDGDCQDQLNSSLEKECGEQDGESKSVETTCINSLVEGTSQVENSQLPDREAIKEEENSADGCGAASNIDHDTHDQYNISSSEKNKSKPCGLSNPCGIKVSRKKLKVDWTPELHRKFVQAVEQLGVNQAIPSRILELMKVEGLTRHNVASHLQQHISGFENADPYDKSYSIAFSPIDLQLADEEIDKVVKEAISKPWLPLPLGLKPPSTESVLSELSKQGISTVPSHINGSKVIQ